MLNLFLKPAAQTIVIRTKIMRRTNVGKRIAPLIGTFLFSTGAIAQPAPSERFVDVRNPEQVPTARYGRGEDVDLSLIIEEWRDRFPATPVFVCTCRNQSCGDTEAWPFREFTLYQPFVALGDTNATNNETTGFKCFDIETGLTPKLQ